MVVVVVEAGVAGKAAVGAAAAVVVSVAVELVVEESIDSSRLPWLILEKEKPESAEKKK